MLQGDYKGGCETVWSAHEYEVMQPTLIKPAMLHQCTRTLSDQRVWCPQWYRACDTAARGDVSRTKWQRGAYSNEKTFSKLTNDAKFAGHCSWSGLSSCVRIWINVMPIFTSTINTESCPADAVAPDTV